MNELQECFLYNLEYRSKTFVVVLWLFFYEEKNFLVQPWDNLTIYMANRKRIHFEQYVPRVRVLKHCKQFQGPQSTATRKHLTQSYIFL